MKLAEISAEVRRFLPFYWLIISVVLVVSDYVSGPFIQFPVVYLIPISLASWYNGRSWGLGLAVILPLIRLLFGVALWKIPWTWIDAGVNCVIRIVVFSLFAILIDRAAERTRELSKEVKMLNGLLSICSSCKKIRDESGEWQPIERYIAQRSDASFSHGLCPECSKKYYDHLFNNKS